VAATIIDGTGLNGSVVKCISGEHRDTVLEGFTITGGNPTTIYGGGMLNFASSSPSVSYCTFTGNNAGVGGGMCNDNSNPSVIACMFSENTVWGNGGGMCNMRGSRPWVANCMFSENVAEDGGGMMNDIDSSPTVLNCMFSGNSAVDGYNPFGGGMYNGNNSDPEITNCTFSGNTAGLEGGGIANLASSKPTVTNCIFWQNSDSGGTDESAQIYNDASVPDVDFSCIQDCSVFCSDPTDHNIGDDPLFVTGSDGDYYLSAADLQGQDSPCVDAGDGGALAVYLHGTTRTDQADDTGIVDMGYHRGAKLQPQTIPIVSEWGLVAMTLLLLTAGTLVFMRRRPTLA
jgi:hypothetical protein